jgi:hypothetical protein
MDSLNTFESKLLKIETDLFNLYTELGDVIKKLENIPGMHKPDLRHIQHEYDTIKYILCGDFGYCPYKDTIVKNPTHREGQTYQIMSIMKLVDTYLKF